MPAFLRTAAGITTMWGLAAFAIAALLQISHKQRGKVPPIAWSLVAGIIVLALVPTLSWVQLQREQARYQEQREEHKDALSATYRVRVTVLSPQHQPVNDAKVTSSMNAIAKKVDGGYEFEIPAVNRPANGKLTIYASVDNAFWNGTSDVQLASDYNPNATVQLTAGENAQVRGIVQDETGNGLEGALVNVVGYGEESVHTSKGGGFTLPAHAADGQQVQLHAEKPDYRAVNQYHPAGREPATLVLQRNRRK